MSILQFHEPVSMHIKNVSDAQIYVYNPAGFHGLCFDIKENCDFLIFQTILTRYASSLRNSFAF